MLGVVTSVLRFQRVGDVLLGFFDAGKLSDGNWAAYLDALKEDGVRVILSLMSDDFDGVSAVQRKAAAEIMKQNSIVAIVVTDSRMIRGVLTAVTWLGANAKPFAWKDVEQAVVTATNNTGDQKILLQLAREFGTSLGKL